jgi:UDP-N-acetylmuramyl tripeptide synthase
MRRNAAIIAAKATAGISRTLHLGGGTALPGLVAERIDPEIVEALSSRLAEGSVLVTGTNGKTTTARLLRSILRAAGLRVIANREGSNMMRGVASALAEASAWSGELERGKHSIGVFEVDEATMPLVARAVKPRTVVFTNLFRDQLDRYGEVETVAALWRKATAEFAQEVTLVLNADDPSVASLADHARGAVVTYGLDDDSVAQAETEHAADARWCTRCGAELEYPAVMYGHIGHWRCPSCGHARALPDIAATGVWETADGLALSIRTSAGPLESELSLVGTYNVYNALAATAAGITLGVEPSDIEKGLAASTAAFGRQERFVIDGREVLVLLAKNPAGANQSLQTVLGGDGAIDIVVLLNDDIADGRDISWIWDVDFELLSGRLNSATISGRRAWDMALRLKYAGLPPENVEHDVAKALRTGIRSAPPGGRVYVLPTYTAMLEVRNILGRWSGRGTFWEGDGQ